MRRFIIFTDEDLDKIKSDQLVVCRDCNFSDKNNEQYDIYCVSENWYRDYTSEENLT